MVEKNMSFVRDDEEIYEKYNEIWEVVRKLLKVDFTVGPVRADKYLVAKLKIFDRINRTTFTNNAIPIEKNHYTCIPAIGIDSVLKNDKRVYPQAYLEQCKYRLKKRKHVNFIDMKLLMMILMIVMTVIIKMKMILLHLDNHKNASKILLQL